MTHQHKTNSDTFLSFFSSFVSTRVGGGVSLGFYITVTVETIKYLSQHSALINKCAL